MRRERLMFLGLFAAAGLLVAAGPRVWDARPRTLTSPAAGSPNFNFKTWMIERGDGQDQHYTLDNPVIGFGFNLGEGGGREDDARPTWAEQFEFTWVADNGGAGYGADYPWREWYIQSLEAGGSVYYRPFMAIIRDGATKHVGSSVNADTFSVSNRDISSGTARQALKVTTNNTGSAALQEIRVYNDEATNFTQFVASTYDCGIFRQANNAGATKNLWYYGQGTYYTNAVGSNAHDRLVIGDKYGNAGSMQFLTMQANWEAVTLNVSHAATVNLDFTLGNVAQWTATADETVNCTGVPPPGKMCEVMVKANGTYTITWGTAFKSTSPTFASAASQWDNFTFCSNGTNLIEIAVRANVPE